MDESGESNWKINSCSFLFKRLSATLAWAVVALLEACASYDVLIFSLTYKKKWSKRFEIVLDR